MSVVQLAIIPMLVLFGCATIAEEARLPSSKPKTVDPCTKFSWYFQKENASLIIRSKIAELGSMEIDVQSDINHLMNTGASALTIRDKAKIEQKLSALKLYFETLCQRMNEFLNDLENNRHCYKASKLIRSHQIWRDEYLNKKKNRHDSIKTDYRHLLNLGKIMKAQRRTGQLKSTFPGVVSIELTDVNYKHEYLYLFLNVINLKINKFLYVKTHRAFFVPTEQGGERLALTPKGFSLKDNFANPYRIEVKPEFIESAKGKIRPAEVKRFTIKTKDKIISKAKSFKLDVAKGIFGNPTKFSLSIPFAEVIAIFSK